MAKQKRRTKKSTPLAGNAFLAKLGDAPAFALKDIAAALYSANGSIQSRVHQLLRSGDLISSVYWPDPNIAIPLPKELWLRVKIENFSIREKNGTGWSSSDYVIRRPILVRHLVLPKLVQLRDSHQSQSATSTGVKFAPPDANEILNFVIGALQFGSSDAEAYVTAPDAREFAKRHFGIIERRGRGAPKTDAEYIVIALLEALRRIKETSRPPKQDALVLEIKEWWNTKFPSSRSETWVRNTIARPIWQAMKLAD